MKIIASKVQHFDNKKEGFNTSLTKSKATHEQFFGTHELACNVTVLTLVSLEDICIENNFGREEAKSGRLYF